MPEVIQIFAVAFFAPAMAGAERGNHLLEIIMADAQTRASQHLERRCYGQAFKRLFVKSPKGVFKMLEKIKRV